MKIPEEMQERINANREKIWLVIEEIQMLAAESDQLAAIARQMNKWVDRVCLKDEDNFNKSSIHWNRRFEGYFIQSAAVTNEIRAKADELNDLTGGLLHLYREQGAETDDEVLSSTILYLNEDNFH